MKNKILIILFVVCCSIKLSGQTNYPFFEQLAFDFYRTEILKKFPVKQKITIYKSLSYEFGEELNHIPCKGLQSEIPVERDSIVKIGYSEYWENIDINKFELNFDAIDKEQFRIKKKNRGSFPKLFVHYPKIYKDRIFVIVHETYIKSGTYYTIEFDLSGKVTDWCKYPYKTIIDY